MVLSNLQLSIDIVNLIVTWEKRRTGITPAKDDLEPGKRSSDGELPSPKRSRIDRAGTAVSTSSGGGWSPAGPLRETIVSFLIRFVSASAEPISANELVKRAFELLKELLVPTPWSAVTVKLPFFSRLLTAVRIICPLPLLERLLDPIVKLTLIRPLLSL
jgi:transformation/transcription domain-associated protein